MKKLILYYNPVSGNATFKNKLDAVIEKFQQRNCVVIPYRTTAGNNARAFCALVREVAADGVIAAGGDGTLSQMANIVVKEQLPLPIAVLGSGTSNDFAMSMGYGKDWDAYFDRVAAGKTRRMDVGCANGEYFINVASAGMLTGIAHDVTHRWKNTFGKMAYYLRGIGEIPKIRPFGLHLDADGRKEDLDAFLFVVANNSAVAGLKNIAPDARVDDGKLDLLVMQKCNPLEFVAIAKDIFAGCLNPPRRHVRYIQARKIRITADVDLVSDLDGEAGPPLPLEIEAVAGAVEVYW